MIRSSGSFLELKLKWKILVVIGIIALIISVILAIILIIIFETDLIPMASVFHNEQNLDKYDYLFDKTEDKNSFEKDLEEIKNNFEKQRSEEIKDKFKNYDSDYEML